MARKIMHSQRFVRLEVVISRSRRWTAVVVLCALAMAPIGALEADAQELVSVRPPLDRKQRPADEAEAQWRLVGSDAVTDSVLDQDPVFQLHRLLARWSDAWANKRVDEYLSYYSEGFAPSDEESTDGWQENRRERLNEPDVIRIVIVGINIVFESDDRAAVRFHQSYRADHYEDRVLKTLITEREEGEWKIVRESSVYPEP